METVEKWFKPASRLLLGVGITCGQERQRIHRGVDGSLLLGIFVNSPGISCLKRMNTVHKICPHPSQKAKPDESRCILPEIHPQRPQAVDKLPVDERKCHDSRVLGRVPKVIRSLSTKMDKGCIGMRGDVYGCIAYAGAFVCRLKRGIFFLDPEKETKRARGGGQTLDCTAALPLWTPPRPYFWMLAGMLTPQQSPRRGASLPAPSATGLIPVASLEPAAGAG